MKGIVSMRNLGCSLLLWFGVMTTLAAEEFDRVVAPFFKAHCVKCHGPEKQKGRSRCIMWIAVWRRGNRWSVGS